MNLIDPFLGSDPRRALWRTAQIDPPWQENGGGKSKRGADKHYRLMSVRQIRSTLLGTGLWRPHVNAHLYCWFTDNFLQDALWLVDQLGFRYVRTIVWVKVRGVPRALDFDTGLAVEVHDGELDLRTGIGQYARGAHESMLFCVRGRGMADDVCTDRCDIPSCFLAPVPTLNGARIHSRKPDAAYELIEARSRGPYHEFFARRGRPSWLAWGDEAPAEAATP